MNTHPVGSIKTLEIVNVDKDKEEMFTKDDKGKTYPPKDNSQDNNLHQDMKRKGEEIFPRRNAQVHDVEPKEDGQYQTGNFQGNNKDLEENLEVTADGMVKLKRKIKPKYLKNRYKNNEE